MGTSTQSAALWLFCMLSACSLAASAAATRGRPVWKLVMLAGGLFVTGVLLLAWTPSTGGAAIVAGCACAWQLLHPGSPAFPAVAAGVCAALAVLVQVQMGAPLPVSIILGLALVGGTFKFAAAERFAPPRMREQALTGLVLAAPVLGALPGVLSGWQSAVTINLAVESRGLASVPPWVWEFGAAMLVLGVLRELWVRR